MMGRGEYFPLTLFPLEIFSCLFASADFFEIIFRKILQEYHLSVENRLDPDQAPRFVGPNLGPISLKML